MQWHSEKNVELTPADISRGSKKRVWWKCELGHQWESAVYTRTGGNAGCPYCAGKKLLPSLSLAAEHPLLIEQWDWEKNIDVLPTDVHSGSNRKIWWKCSRGHEWQAPVKSRVRGYDCPICTNRRIVKGENDLASTHPCLAAQWHPTRNGTLTPDNILGGSSKKVWWRCESGHEWKAVVYSRARGIGCPYCSGKLVVPGENDLASQFPELAEQWHSSKNGALTPDKVAPQSNRRSWWICSLGHEYSAIIADRTSKQSGCPYCSGRKVLAGFNDLTTREPKIAAQWHRELNGSLRPEMVTPGSTKKVWWQCDEGHVWHAVVNSRAGKKKCGCPVCSGRVSEARQARYVQIMEESMSKRQQETAVEDADKDK